MNAHAATPEAFPALVLNADFRPLSYYPLSLWSWQESVKAVFLDRVNIVSEYDRFVRSPSFEMRLPSRGVAQDLRQAGALSGVHAVQRVPARPLHVPVLRVQGRPDVRPPDPALARRPDAVGQRGGGLRAVQSEQGRAPGPSTPACGRGSCPTGRRCSSCTATGGCSRPTTCTRAGSTISTGIPSWSLDGVPVPAAPAAWQASSSARFFRSLASPLPCESDSVRGTWWRGACGLEAFPSLP